jgi:hypothetical protein
MQQKDQPSSSWAAWENPLPPAKYSTFTDQSESPASPEGRTSDLQQELSRSFIAKDGGLTN